MLKAENIDHLFLTKCHDIQGLFQNTNKLSTFINKLEKQSIIDPIRYDINKYLGDGFEFFVEVLLKTHYCDNRIGITEYKPIQENDNGVDGIGYNLSGKPSAIQIKFRSNKNTVLTNNEDNLSNLIMWSAIQHKIYPIENLNEVPQHYVITTAKGLHHYTDQEVYKGKVKCIGYDELRSMLDNNLSFWNQCRILIDKSLN